MITNYFEVMTLTYEDFIIDHDRSIRKLEVIRSVPKGQINFKGFSVSPDNGKKDTSTASTSFHFPGEYTIKFLPNYDIPIDGII